MFEDIFYIPNDCLPCNNTFNPIESLAAKAILFISTSLWVCLELKRCRNTCICQYVFVLAFHSIQRFFLSRILYWARYEESIAMACVYEIEILIDSCTYISSKVAIPIGGRKLGQNPLYLTICLLKITRNISTFSKISAVVEYRICAAIDNKQKPKKTTYCV